MHRPRFAVMLCLLVLAVATGAAEPAHARAPRAFFGVVAPGALKARDFDRMGAGNVGVVRFAIAWAQVQPTRRGGYRWSRIDRTMAQAAGQGVAALPFLTGTPGWVARDVDDYRCGARCGAYAPASGAALEAWSQFVAAAVERYGDGGAFWAANPNLPALPVATWQIWSGQNTAAAFRPRPSPRRYARLLDAAARAIEATDASAEILLGGMPGRARGRSSMNGSRYLAKLFRLGGARRDFDGVAVHPSASTVETAAVQVRQMRATVVRAHAPETKLWVTRIGFGSARGGDPRNKGKVGQARDLRQAYGYLLAHREQLNLESVDWYSWADSKRAGCTWCKSSGLFTRARKPKPSWRAFTRLARRGCPARKCDGEAATDRPNPNSFFGVTPQYPFIPDADLLKLARANVGTLRFVMPWEQVQPSWWDQPFDFSRYDSVVLAAAARGIRLVPVLHGSPNWLGYLEGTGCDPSCGAYAPRSDAALAAWRQFVGAAAARYGPNGSLWREEPSVPALPITVWQVWNEQNAPGFYKPSPDPDAYARLVSATAEEIRSRDPGAQVILGGMHGLGGSDPPSYSAVDFLHQLYAMPGARRDFDGVAVHPYSRGQEGMERQATDLRAEMVASGDGSTPLWVTEIGAASDYGPLPQQVGPEGQADLLTRAYRFFLSKQQSWNIPAVIWYSWRDSPRGYACRWCTHSGLFGIDGDTPKPAWSALLSITGGA